MTNLKYRKPVYICSECLQEDPSIIIYDFGVGPNYYGDSFSNHKDEVPVTECCESPAIYEINTDLLTVPKAVQCIQEGRWREKPGIKLTRPERPKPNP